MTKVHTIHGLIDRDLLEARDIVFEEENSRAVATEWTLIETGEMVRRDVAVSILSGQAIFGEQAEMG